MLIFRNTRHISTIISPQSSLFVFRISIKVKNLSLVPPNWFRLNFMELLNRIHHRHKNSDTPCISIIQQIRFLDRTINISWKKKFAFHWEWKLPPFFYPHFSTSSHFESMEKVSSIIYFFASFSGEISLSPMNMAILFPWIRSRYKKEEENLELFELERGLKLSMNNDISHIISSTECQLSTFVVHI